MPGARSSTPTPALEYLKLLTLAGRHVNVISDFEGSQDPSGFVMTNAKTSPKLFYRIEEVSRLTKVGAATIESWEKEFPFLQPGWTASGQKIFRPKDVEIIVRIKALLDEKSVTLAGARRRIEDELGLRNAAPVHPDKLKKTLLQVRDELEDMARNLDGKGKKS